MDEMDALPSPPAVNALRESFGDRKPPDITRKITACVACRKQKTLLEEDVTWKGAMVRKIRRLEEAISQIANKVDIPELKSQHAEIQESLSPPPVDLTNAEPAVFSPEYQPQAQPQAPPQQRDDRELPRTWEVVMDPRGGPASIPASCLSDSSRGAPPNGLPNARQPDLISTGLITLRQALALFEEYHLRLDHFLYRILGDHISLDSVRVASPLLTAAVCTVGALHSQSLGQLFDVCYNEFKNLVSAQMFSQTANADDIRGLCIGAFWLHELSWALIGNAVRVASDIHLHGGIYKALKGDREGYLQVRLYYLVYVCDHHFSIAYGRPPMSHEGFIIKSASRMLQNEHATEDDARLISQVQEWSILGQVFDTFGVDVDTAIAPQAIPQLRRYSIALDTWLADWNESFGANRNVGNYPQKGVGFHFHFAKLYLCSHAFRGMPATENLTEWFTPELEEIANTGALSAMSILRVIVSDAEFRSFMNGLPLYFDTMLAFAVVFLLKVATKYATVIRIDTSKILSLVAQTVAALREITQTMHRQHLLVVIAEGLGRLLSRCQVPPQTSTEVMYHHPSPMVDPNHQFDMAWMENMASFDFQTHFPDLDEWWLHYSTSMAPHAQRL
ncbi:hypothetical protein N7466_007645 [Penicillium verhagenii]|uniref:uncharacterized protein n=1 Tax=Penicillium verhagenii TaxID=1562060 RepID=UPI002545186F|nr:uncharacterized protein N7466_007645 [Penicillium verhagenii]KAJ5928689.1 hypothetical protein N7466_007645 [Penicillium verhagenii]